MDYNQLIFILILLGLIYLSSTKQQVKYFIILFISILIYQSYLLSRKETFENQVNFRSSDDPLSSIAGGTPTGSSYSKVTIKDNLFDPETLQVKVNTVVEWVHLDEKNQTVYDIVSTDKIFRSKPLKYGESYHLLFDRTGIYTYYSTYHPSMLGTIIVS